MTSLQDDPPVPSRLADGLDEAVAAINAAMAAPPTLAGLADAGVSGVVSPVDTAPRKRRRGRRRATMGDVRAASPRDVVIAESERLPVFQDRTGDAYVSIAGEAGVPLHYLADSRVVRSHLTKHAFIACGDAPTAQHVEDGVRLLTARAMTAPVEPVHLRVGAGARGEILIDRGGADGAYYAVAPDGWSVRSDGVPKFVRRRGMLPIVMPVRGGSVMLLRKFVNTSDADFHLLVGAILQFLHPAGPYPILALSGEQGSGKSVISTLVRRICDPSSVPISAAPKDGRDAAVAAFNARLLAFDNLSGVSSELSDILCRLSTGGGMRTRSLYSNSEEFFFEGCRPQLVNGIGDVTGRPDMADRCVVVQLQTIDERSRRSEREFWEAFDEVEALIFGALLTALSAGLRNLDRVQLDRAPRLIDFAKWATACEEGLGPDWPRGAFLDAYMANRREAREASFEGDLVATEIDRFIRNERPEGFNGTATELLAILSARVSDDIKRRRDWPFSPAGLGTRLDRAAPLLRARGFVVERHRANTRTITIALRVSPPGDAA